MRPIRTALAIASFQFSLSAYAAPCILGDPQHPEMWPRTDSASYAECLQQEGAKAYEDYSYAMKQRGVHDAMTGWIIETGIQRLKLERFPGLQNYITAALTSNYLTDDVKQGLQARYQKFAYEYAKASHADMLSFSQVTELKRAWADLDEYLAAAYVATKLDDEKALITQLRKQGALSADGLTLLSVLKHSSADKKEIQALLTQQFKVNKEQVNQILEEKLKDIVAIGTEQNAEANKKAAGEAKLQTIAEVATGAHALVAAAQLGALINPADAVRLSRVIDGVTSVSMAATMLSTGVGYASVAGPYGLAFSGMVSLAGAFGKQGKSESAQIMGMLASISKQISQLQYSVDRGFADVKSMLTENEIRLMGKLSEVLASNAEISVKVDQFAEHLAELRSQFYFARRQDQVGAISISWADIAYQDTQCLRSFGWTQQSQRDSCVTGYAALLKKFLVNDNAVFIGTALASFPDNAPPDDVLAKIKESLVAAGLPPVAGTPIHTATFERLSQRIYTFIALNPSMLKTLAGKDLYDRTRSGEKEMKDFLAFLTNDATMTTLKQQYEKEYVRVLAGMTQVSDVHQKNRNVSQSDKFNIAERDNYNLPVSFNSTKALFPSSTAALYGAIKSEDEGRSLIPFLSEAPTGDNPLSRKIARISDIALTRDLDATIYYQDELSGHFWVEPCNKESGYPAFPIERAIFAANLSSVLARMSLGGKGMVELCYTPDARESNANIGIGNGNAGMDIVRQRFGTVNMDGTVSYGSMFKTNQWCVTGASYFQQTYGRFPEYAASNWEKCHHGHIHHELYARTPQLFGFSFTLTVKFPGYESPIKSFLTRVESRNDYLDKCFLPFDHEGHASRFGVFLPFRQQYPLPISRACPGVDSALGTALANLKQPVQAFLDKNTTMLKSAPTEKLTYAAAAKQLSEAETRRFREAYLQTLFALPVDFSKLNLLAKLISAAEFYRKKDDGLDEFYPDSSQIVQMAQVLLFDAEKRIIRPISILQRPGPSSN
jgi:hypothetical protein